MSNSNEVQPYSPYEKYVCFPTLLLYFSRGEGSENPIESAVCKMQEIARKVCESDSERLDDFGLPRSLEDNLNFEAAISSFLNSRKFEIANISFENFPAIDDELMQVNGLVRSVLEMEDGRGSKPFHALFDPDDEDIGVYVQSVSALDDTRAKSKRVELMKKTIPIAREMILLIGPERYDQLRHRFNSVFFERHSANDILQCSVNEIIERHEGFTPFNEGAAFGDPKKWTMDLIILVKNPALLEALVNYDGVSQRENLKYWILFFHQQERNAMKAEIFEEIKMNEGDYLRRLIEDSGEFSTEEIDLLARALPSVTSIVFQGFVYENRKDDDVQSVMRWLIKEFFDGVDKSEVFKLKFLLKRFCSTLVRMIKTYRSGDSKVVDPASFVITDKTLAPVLGSLADTVHVENRFKPLNKEIGSFLIKIYPDENCSSPLLKLINIEDIEIVCEDLSFDEFKEKSKDFELSADVLTAINDSFELIREKQAENSRNLLNLSNEDTVYAYGTLIRFAANVFPRIFCERGDKI